MSNDTMYVPRSMGVVAFVGDETLGIALLESGELSVFVNGNPLRVQTPANEPARAAKRLSADDAAALYTALGRANIHALATGGGHAWRVEGTDEREVVPVVDMSATLAKRAIAIADRVRDGFSTVVQVSGHPSVELADAVAGLAHAVLYLVEQKALWCTCKDTGWSDPCPVHERPST